jgi:uncharacterized membrane protein YadS
MKRMCRFHYKHLLRTIELRSEPPGLLFIFTAAGIVFTLGCGFLLGKLLQTDGRTSTLVSFGTAIHDTSSVVGAASAYGKEALEIGTTVKLSRAIWIAPAVMITALILKKSGRPKVPLFIIGFIAAAALRALLPGGEALWHATSLVARQSLVVTLFLIGTGLSPSVLRRVGPRPLAQGLALWAIVSIVTYEAVMSGWVG